MLTAMQFETFIWPHNPATYTLRYARNLVVHPLPYNTYSVEDLGTVPRVMEGVGEFFGKDAYHTFLELAALYDRQSPGVLLHPLWQSSCVYFDLLQAMQEPREDYIRYAFRFVEAAPNAQQRGLPEQTQFRVSAGQTLWDVAQQVGRSTAELLLRNPQLRTCNDLQAGEAVRL